MQEAKLGEGSRLHRRDKVRDNPINIIEHIVLRGNCSWTDIGGCLGGDMLQEDIEEINAEGGEDAGVSIGGELFRPDGQQVIRF